MSAKSKIEWTDSTWTPLRAAPGLWHCVKISPGCAHCYSERHNIRFGGQPFTPAGAKNVRAYLDEKTLEQPLRWRSWQKSRGRPRRIFVCANTDLFYEGHSDDMIERVFTTMFLAKDHAFQVLTKRAHRMQQWMSIYGNPCRAIPPGAWPLTNVHLGVSVESPDYLWRVEELLKIPAAVRFVSLEPLLGPVNIAPYLKTGNTPKQLGGIETALYERPAIDWVIVGGESGPGARPMHPDWVRSIRDQCISAGVPFFFKQWGAWQNGSTFIHRALDHFVFNDGRVFRETGDVSQEDRSRWDSLSPVCMARVGKRAAGRILDGRTWDEFPKGRT